MVETGRSGSIGPVDYLVVLSPGGGFAARTAPELAALARSGDIKVIDLVVVTRDDEGIVGTIDAEDLGCEAGAALAELCRAPSGRLSRGDIFAIGEVMPAGSSAVALLIESTWNERLRDVIEDARSIILTEGSIPRRLVMQAGR